MLGFSDTSAGEESSCIAGDPGTIPGSGILIRCRRDSLPSPVFLGILCGSAGKESVCNAGDLGLIPGLRRFLGEGKGYPLQYSGLENSMDCIVHGVAKSRTQLSNLGFPDSSVGKESICSAGDLGLIPGLRRSPGGGHGNPLQCSCLENPMDRGALWTAVHGVTKSQT